MPDVTTNDANMFVDDDGQVYVFLTVRPRIVRLHFNPETCRTYGEPHTVIATGADCEWDHVGIEGGFPCKRRRF